MKTVLITLLRDFRFELADGYEPRARAATGARPMQGGNVDGTLAPDDGRGGAGLMLKATRRR